MRYFTASDEIRVKGMSASLDPSSAAMLEFQRITQDRQCAVIADQATALLRQHRKIQTLKLCLFAACAVAALALAENLGWLG